MRPFTTSWRSFLDIRYQTWWYSLLVVVPKNTPYHDRAQDLLRERFLEPLEHSTARKFMRRRDISCDDNRVYIYWTRDEQKEKAKEAVLNEFSL